MDQSKSGVGTGVGMGVGFCGALIFIPLGLLVIIAYGCSSSVDRMVEKHHRQQPDREQIAVAELQGERREKLKLAGVEDVPDVAVNSEAEMRKQMRIEGIAPSQDLIDVFKDSDALAEAAKPLKEAAGNAMTGHIEGEVLMLQELAGFVKGDDILQVMQQFDAPDHRGETNEVLRYSQGWPDLMYYSYDRANTTFLVRNGKVELILVGLTYRDAVD